MSFIASLTLLHQQDAHPDQHSPVHWILHVSPPDVSLLNTEEKTACLSEISWKCFSSRTRSDCVSVQHSPKHVALPSPPPSAGTLLAAKLRKAHVEEKHYFRLATLVQQPWLVVICHHCQLVEAALIIWRRHRPLPVVTGFLTWANRADRTAFGSYYVGIVFTAPNISVRYYAEVSGNIYTTNTNPIFILQKSNNNCKEKPNQLFIKLKH